jgi:hypothetical protein
VHRFALGLAIAILSLTGCATSPSPPTTDKLQLVASPRFLVLNEPLYWRLDYRPADIGVVAGVYQATQENSLGTFFEGPPGAYFLLSNDDKSGSYAERTDGGLWIPKDGGPAKVWAWFDAHHKLTIHAFSRRGTPNEILTSVTGEAGGTQPVAGTARTSSGAEEGVARQAALGQVPGVGRGAGVLGAVIGGAVVDYLANRDVGMRNVAMFSPPSDEARRQFQALTQTVTSGSPPR